MCFYKQSQICQKRMNVCEICWGKISTIYICENAFGFFLLKKFNQKLFKEKLVSDTLGHPVQCLIYKLCDAVLKFIARFPFADL